MKVCYFDNQNIDSVSESILNYTYSIIGKQRILNIEKPNSALIVLDMQDYFLSTKSHAYVPSAEFIIPHINSLITMCVDNNMPVVFTKHINNESNVGMMGKWWKDRLEQKNDLSKISNSIIIPDDAKLIEKSQYDAFYNTELHEYLQVKKIKNLLVTGVMTNLCVETTVRSAFVNGYLPVLPIDCTAAYNIEFHKASALNLAYGCSVVCLTKDLIRYFK